jgi:hypothetical protein
LFVTFATSASTCVVEGAPAGGAEMSLRSLPFETLVAFTFPAPSVYSEFVCRYGVPPTCE